MTNPDINSYDQIDNTANYWQHTDGGVYRVLNVVTSTVDGKSKLVIYEHLFPFEYSVWGRPIEEWTLERFTPLTFQEYFAIIGPIAVDPIAIAQFRSEITERKAARKAQK